MQNSALFGQKMLFLLLFFHSQNALFCSVELSWCSRLTHTSSIHVHTDIPQYCTSLHLCFCNITSDRLFQPANLKLRKETLFAILVICIIMLGKMVQWRRITAISSTTSEEHACENFFSNGIKTLTTISKSTLCSAALSQLCFAIECNFRLFLRQTSCNVD